MGRETGRFGRADRLRRPREFQAVTKQGQRVAAQAFVGLLAPCQQVPSSGLAPRLGITVSRKVGCAVVRNRVKRRVREWFRHSRDALPRGLDLVVIARRPAAGLDQHELGVALSELMLRWQRSR